MSGTSVPLHLVLTIPFIVQIAGLVGLVGYLSYRSGQQTIEQLAHQLIETVVHQVDQELDGYLHTAHEANQRHIAAIASGAIDVQNIDQLHRYLILQHQQTKNLTTFLFGAPNGDLRVSHRVNAEDLGLNTRLQQDELPYEVAISSPSNPSLNQSYSTNEAGDLVRFLETVHDLDVRDRPWYRRAVVTGKAGWIGPFQISNTHLLSLNAYAPFYDKVRQISGVFAVNISLNQLDDFLSRLKVGQTGEVFIMERNSLLIANSTAQPSYFIAGRPDVVDTTNPKNLTFKRLSPDNIANGVIQQSYRYLKAQLHDFSTVRSPQAFPMQMGNERYFVSVVPYNGDYELNWLIVTVVPESEFMTQIYVNARRTVVLCGLALLGSVGLSIWTSRRLGRSLQRLSHAAQSVAAGTLDQPLPSTHISEVELLSASFRQMVQELQNANQLRQNYTQDLERQVAEKTAALTEAQRIARVGSWQIDLTTGASTWSTEHCRILGFDPAETLPVYPQILDLIPLDERPKVQRAMAAAIDQGIPYAIEHSIIRADNTLCYVVSRGEAVFDQQGQVTQLVGTLTDISEQHAALQERKHAETALQQTLKELNYHIENSPLATLRWDQDFRMEYWSKQAERIFGWTAEDVLGKTMYDWKFIVEEDLDHVNQAAAQLLSGVGIICQNRNYRKDGSIINCEWYNSILVDESGNLISILSLAQDISDRKQAEAALAQEIFRRRMLFDTSIDGIVVLDHSGNIIEANASFAKMLGYSLDEIKTLNLVNFDAQWSPDELEQKLENKDLCTNLFETLHRRKDGSIYHVEISSNSVDWDGQSVQLCICRDISERKRSEAERKAAEVALQHSEARFQTLVKNIPGSIYRYYPSEDGCGFFTYFSSGSYELLELTPEDILHDENSIWNLIHPDDLPLLKESIAFAVSNILPWQWEGRLTTPSGRRKWVQGNSRPQDTPEGIVWDGLLIDITERKHLEQELVKNRDFRELLFNESSDALFLVDSDTWLTVDCNQRAIEMFEVASKAELINIEGCTLQKRQFTPDERIILAQNLEQKNFWRSEIEYVTSKGNEFWGDISITPISFGVQHFLLVRVVDISDRKQTEAALQQAKQQLEARIADLNQRHSEMVLLSELSDFLQACLTVNEVHQAIAHLVEPLFPSCSGGFLIIDGACHWVKTVSSWGGALRSVPEFHLNDCWALRRGQMHWVEPKRPELRCNHVADHDKMTSATKLSLATLCIPMIAQGETLGLFYLSAEHLTALPNAKQQLARTVAEQMALAIANLTLRETLKQQSIRDPLTGLFNRRYLEEAFAQEISRAQRYHHTIGVIMIDLDHFKRFNDSCGHDAGDYVLQTVGTLLREKVRGSDIACRYGGEEIILVLPELSLQETQHRAEEIRLAISQLYPICNDQPLGPLTASLGIASFPQHGTTGSALIQAADMALYRAKASGRNQVAVAL